MTELNVLNLDENRYFSANPAEREYARHLYAGVKDLPLICPHGHVDPDIFADPDYRFDSPTELLLVPDHYIFRMLYWHHKPIAGKQLCFKPTPILRLILEIHYSI